MTLSDISIRNPVFAWMLMAAFIIFGFICFMRMGVANLPDVNFPVVNVSITLPNASPEVVESDVADPVEQAVLGAQGVIDVQTTCTQGNANISVYLDLSRDVDAAVQDVQTLVFQAQKQLPTNIYPPVIRKYNPNSSPILWLAVTADPPLTLRDMMLYSRDHIQDKFTSLNGVANVFLGGFLNREINLWIDNNKLNARQLTANDIINTILHQHQETPAGSMETPETQYAIRVMGEAYTVPDFANLPILTRGGSPNYTLTRLKDVATIEDGVVTPVTRLSRFDSVPAVGLGIVMQDGYNAVEVGTAAKVRMEEVKKTLPKGFHISLNFDTTKFIKDNVNELLLTILLATFLTASVCFLFLGSLSSTINVFLAIPTSIFGTFIVMSFFGFNLNTFTLLALSLSIGVVVDDAIMVLENIVRHQERGEDQVEAALIGAREITFAAMATSLAIVAIFLPIAFMQGIIGKFFFQFGVTLSGAVLISLLEAITLTPMRCSEFVHAGGKENRFVHFVNTQFNGLRNFYSKLLHWCLEFLAADLLKDAKSADFPKVKNFFSYLLFILVRIFLWAVLCGAGFYLNKYMLRFLPWEWLHITIYIIVVLALIFGLFSRWKFIAFENAHLFRIHADRLISGVQAELKNPTYSVIPIISSFIVITVLLLIRFFWTTPLGNAIFLCILGGFVLTILIYLLVERHFVFYHFFYDRRWWVITVSFFIFLGSFFMLKFIKVNFSPSTDQSAFVVNMKLPVTYSLTSTDQIVRKCEAVMLQQGEVKHIYTALGGFGSATPNQAVFFLTMKDPGDRPTVAESEKFKPVGPLSFLVSLWQRMIPQHYSEFEFMDWTRKALSKVSPDLQVFCLDLSQRGMSTGKGYAVEMMVTGPDWDTLADCIRKIRKALRASPKLSNVDDNFLDGQPEIRIIPDRVKAALMGVSMDDLGNVIGSTIGGYQFQGTYFHEGGHDNPICIRVPIDQRKGPDSIKSIYVRNNRGEVLPVSAVATLQQVPAYQQIFRDNRQRAVYITAGVGTGASQQEAVNEAVQICKSILPDGYNVQLTGSAQSNADTFKQLMIVMILGIMVAYMVLASQFNSFVHPIVILLALPFSVTGALLTLWLFGQSLGMYSFIGIILLMGLVKKNSIMLVDFTNQRRHAGMGVHEALMDACPVRLRPILMTSSATVAGALPAALAWGPGAELRQPMALAIIGGIIFSTLLTLIVVPCAYSFMSGLDRRREHHSAGLGRETQSHSPAKAASFKKLKKR